MCKLKRKINKKGNIKITTCIILYTYMYIEKYLLWIINCHLFWINRERYKTLRIWKKIFSATDILFFIHECTKHFTSI